MSALRVLAARASGVWAKRKMEARLEEELRCHMEMLVEENLRRGMTPEEARRAARREFGGVEQVKETWRDTLGFPALDSLVQDVRCAARGMRRNPGFTAAGGGGAGGGHRGEHNGVQHPEHPVLPAAALSRCRAADAAGRNARETAAGRRPHGAGPLSQFRRLAGAGAVVRIDGRVPRRRLQRDGGQPAGAGARASGFRRGTSTCWECVPCWAAGSRRRSTRRAGRRWCCSARNTGGAPGRAVPMRSARSLRINGERATVVGVMPGRLRATLVEGSPRLWMPLAPRGRRAQPRDAAGSRHGAAEARRHRGTRAGGDGRHRAAPGGAVPGHQSRLGGARRRPCRTFFAEARSAPATKVLMHDGGAAAAHRLRERGQPAAGPRRRAAEGGGAAGVARARGAGASCGSS